MIRTVNRAFEEASGWSALELIGKHIAGFMPEEYRSHYRVLGDVEIMLPVRSKDGFVFVSNFRTASCSTPHTAE